MAFLQPESDREYAMSLAQREQRIAKLPGLPDTPITRHSSCRVALPS
jgi:hypothetical protein